ncbi:hypothetical protein ACFLZ2_05955 [Candidatus Margulisiibacteriota bacterium]
MATILFIVLRFAGLIDTKMDWIFLCYLVALDTIGIPTLIQMMSKK